MSKRTRRRRRAQGGGAGPALKSWTIQRAEAAGIMAGLIALLFWSAFASWPQALEIPFALALGATAFCGLSILWITARDMAAGPKRGKMLRAIRVLDVAIGVALALPSLYALRLLAREWGL